jgi:hypothetical protein
MPVLVRDALPASTSPYGVRGLSFVLLRKIVARCSRRSSMSTLNARAENLSLAKIAIIFIANWKSSLSVPSTPTNQASSM